jgi:hypothetical protein
MALGEFPSCTPQLDGGTEALGNDLATGLSDQESRFTPIPEAPGTGVELVPGAEKRFPFRGRPMRKSDPISTAR